MLGAWHLKQRELAGFLVKVRAAVVRLGSVLARLTAIVQGKPVPDPEWESTGTEILEQIKLATRVASKQPQQEQQWEVPPPEATQMSMLLSPADDELEAMREEQDEALAAVRVEMYDELNQLRAELAEERHARQALQQQVESLAAELQHAKPEREHKKHKATL